MQKNKILPKLRSVAGIIFSSDRTSVLLIFRRDIPVWVLPGGGIEPNETAEDAVCREILEETGFHVKVERLVGHYFPQNKLAKQTQLFECTILSGEAKITAESRSTQFFPLSCLPPLPPPYRNWIEESRVIKAPIERILSEVCYSALFSYLFSHPVLVFRFFLSRMKLPFNST